jgi:hypothetical protein
MCTPCTCWHSGIIHHGRFCQQPAAPCNTNRECNVMSISGLYRTKLSTINWPMLLHSESIKELVIIKPPIILLPQSLPQHYVIKIFYFILFWWTHRHLVYRSCSFTLKSYTISLIHHCQNNVVSKLNNCVKHAQYPHQWFLIHNSPRPDPITSTDYTYATAHKCIAIFRPPWVDRPRSFCSRSSAFSFLINVHIISLTIISDISLWIQIQKLNSRVEKTAVNNKQWQFISDINA